MQPPLCNQKEYKSHIVAPRSLWQETGVTLDALLVLRAVSMYRMCNVPQQPVILLFKIMKYFPGIAKEVWGTHLRESVTGTRAAQSDFL